MPTVSIVITAYHEQSRPYLDLLMRSIAALDYPSELLDVVIVSPAAYAPLYIGARTLSPAEPYVNAHALNEGAKFASTSDYLLFLNDDVILTRDSLKRLVEAQKALGDHALVMPVGNDTQCGRYWLSTPIAPGPYRLEQVSTHAAALMQLASPYPAGLVFVDILYMYAVLVPTKVFADVGPWDDARSGLDDADYSMRAKAKGYHLALALDSLCFHAGGVTADITMTQELRESARKSFDEKWAEPSHREKDFLGE